MRTAKELETAWNEASLESGFYDPGKLTRVKAEKARDDFYQIFFKKTGLHESLVRGLFNDWCKLPHGVAVSLGATHGVQHSFCAYLAEYLHKKAVARMAGEATAYIGDDTIDGDLH